MLEHIGHIKLEALEPIHVRTMLSALARSGLSPRSVYHVRSVLRNALNMAVKDDIVLRNVVERTDAPRVDAYEAHVLSEDEIIDLINVCNTERLGLLFHIAVTLGLRSSELLALRWADLDWKNRTLQIAKSKTAAGKRTLPLTDDLIVRFKAHWDNQQEERTLLGERWKEHSLIFASEVGTPMGSRNIQRIFKRILRAAGLDKSIRLHDLRHTAITDWIASGGADPKTAQALAGHSDAHMTMRVYAKVRNERLRETIEAVEQQRKKA